MKSLSISIRNVVFLPRKRSSNAAISASRSNVAEATKYDSLPGAIEGVPRHARLRDACFINTTILHRNQGDVTTTAASDEKSSLSVD